MPKGHVHTGPYFKALAGSSFEPWQAMVVRHCGSGTGCMARGVASLEGWSPGQDSILGSIRCGGTGLPQALGLFVSLPIRRAIARLVPNVYGTLPPREGGPC